MISVLNLNTRVCLLIIFMYAFIQSAAQQNSKQLIGAIHGDGKVYLLNKNGLWGLSIETKGLNSAIQWQPIQVEFFQDSLNIVQRASGYTNMEVSKKGFIGKASIQYKKASLQVEDRWHIDGDVLNLSRKVTCIGNEAGGFMSAITLPLEKGQTREQLNYFAPGIIYGSTENLTDVAIGGKKYQDHIRIREDRIPAPLFGIHFMDGYSISILDTNPKGKTTVADAMDIKAVTLVEAGLQFGSMGVDNVNNETEIGFWYPGTEGEVTYQGNTYPGGQMHKWRRRYHPLAPEVTHQYSVAFRFAKKENFQNYYSNAWQWSWQTLKPVLEKHDMKVVRESLVKQLASEVIQYPQGWGISNWANAVKDEDYHRDSKCIMGFTGKALETAEILLLDAALHSQSGYADSLKIKAIGLINNFIDHVSIVPATAEGFNLINGKPSQALFVQGVGEVFLRSYTDDLKALLRAYLLEKKKGGEHKEWLVYAQKFGDWLLPQQSSAGGFPRTWEFGTGKLKDASQQSSYNVVPYLCLLTQATGEPQYLEAAKKAADFMIHKQKEGRFGGGTIDNPDIIDKEGGTLSLEGYLTLYEMTKDKKWITAAEGAARFAETWIFLWNVPMTKKEKDGTLHWKEGVNTTGAQLIATGHSLTDNYMAFDVDEFAHLYKLTGNNHYKDVAKLLLHNTKSMIALPHRLYDLRDTGWSQEHFTFAPPRGLSLHRGWLPWVTTAHLNGILMLEQMDAALYEDLKK